MGEGREREDGECAIRLKKKLITRMAGSLEDGSTPVITNGRDWAHKYLGLKLIWCHVSKLVQ